MSASEWSIRVVAPRDLPAFRAALQALASDLDDPFRADEASLRAALFETGAAFGLLAERNDRTAGAALASPVFSTTFGGAGVYVSDLWVAPGARGMALGQRLLAAAARQGANRWAARYLKLTVYDDNAQAQAFYARMGFSLRPRDRVAVMAADAFADLAGATA